MKNILKTILFCIILSGCKKDKDLIFKGKVIDSEKGKPVVGAKVIATDDISGIISVNREAYTNSNGEYLIKLENYYVKDGGVKFFISCSKYEYDESEIATTFVNKTPASFSNDFTIIPYSVVVKVNVKRKDVNSNVPFKIFYRRNYWLDIDSCNLQYPKFDTVLYALALKNKENQYFTFKKTRNGKDDNVYIPFNSKFEDTIKLNALIDW